MYTMHISYFAGVPHGKTTVFIIKDSSSHTSDDVDALERFSDAHYHIIDITNITPQLMHDRESYLMCSGTHYGFHCCVLKVHQSSTVTNIGWPCHFYHYLYYATPNAVGWWQSIYIPDNFSIPYVEHGTDSDDN